MISWCSFVSVSVWFSCNIIGSMFGEAAMAECVLKLQHACVNRTSRSSPVHGVMCMVKRGGFARLLGKQVDYSGSLLWVLRFHYVNVVWTDTAHLLLALGSGWWAARKDLVPLTGQNTSKVQGSITLTTPGGQLCKCIPGELCMSATTNLNIGIFSFCWAIRILSYVSAVTLWTSAETMYPVIFLPMCIWSSGNHDRRHLVPKISAESSRNRWW